MTLRWLLPALTMLTMACQGRPPAPGVDGGAGEDVDAGVDDDPFPPGEPGGVCRVTADCRVGNCVKQRCVPLGVTCLDDRYANVASLAASRPPFVDCAEWGAHCLSRRGCALPPGARCEVAGEQFLPCGGGDICVDQFCAVDDAGGFADATPLSLPGQVTFSGDEREDIDCFVVDASLNELGIDSIGPLLLFAGVDPLSGNDAAPTTLCTFGAIGHSALAVRHRSSSLLQFAHCGDDHTIVDGSGATTTCSPQTVCRRLPSLNFACVPAIGEPCAEAARCEGYCLVSPDICVPLPTPLPPQDRCSRLPDGRSVYGGFLRGFVCTDRCEDGIGCINGAPTTTCAMFIDDPAGGLGRCAEPDVPAWERDDLPGHFSPAPEVAPGEYQMVSTSSADVDCVAVVVPGRSVLFGETTTGTITLNRASSLGGVIVEAGDQVRACLAGHSGTATVRFETEALE